MTITCTPTPPQIVAILISKIVEVSFFTKFVKFEIICITK